MIKKKIAFTYELSNDSDNVLVVIIINYLAYDNYP